MIVDPSVNSTTRLLPVSQMQLETLQTERINPRKRYVVLVALTNTAAGVAIIWNMVIVNREYNSEQPSWTIIGVCQFTAGMLANQIIESTAALFRKVGEPFMIDHVNNFGVTFALPISFLLFNGWDNASASVQPWLAGIRQIFLGYLSWRNGGAYYNNPTKDKGLDEDRPIQNELLTPAYNDLRGQIKKYTIITAISVAARGFSYLVSNPQVATLLAVGSNYYIPQGVGFFGTHYLLSVFKKWVSARKDVDLLKNHYLRNLVTPQRLITITWIVRGTQEVGAAAIYALPYFVTEPNFASLFGGLMCGSLDRRENETIECMTAVDWTRLQSHFYHPNGDLKLVGKVYQFAGLMFTFGIGTFFAVGVAESTEEEEKVVAAAMAGTTFAAYLLGKVFLKLYDPALHLKIMNELFKQLKNPYNILVLFNIFREVVGNPNSQNIENSTGFTQFANIGLNIVYAVILQFDYVTGGKISKSCGLTDDTFWEMTTTFMNVWIAQEIGGIVENYPLVTNN